MQLFSWLIRYTKIVNEITINLVEIPQEFEVALAPVSRKLCMMSRVVIVKIALMDEVS